MQFEKISCNVNVQLSIGHKAFNLSLSKLIIKAKTSFAKVVHYCMLFENVSQKVKAVIHSLCLRHIKVLLKAYIKDILGIYQPYLGNILGMNKGCLRNISNISQEYLRYLLGILRASVQHIRGIAQIFKYILTYDKISINSISFNI